MCSRKPQGSNGWSGPHILRSGKLSRRALFDEPLQPGLWSKSWVEGVRQSLNQPLHRLRPLRLFITDELYSSFLCRYPSGRVFPMQPTFRNHPALTTQSLLRPTYPGQISYSSWTHRQLHHADEHTLPLQAQSAGKATARATHLFGSESRHATPLFQDS